MFYYEIGYFLARESTLIFLISFSGITYRMFIFMSIHLLRGGSEKIINLMQMLTNLETDLIRSFNHQCPPNFLKRVHLCTGVSTSVKSDTYWLKYSVENENTYNCRLFFAIWIHGMDFCTKIISLY